MLLYANSKLKTKCYPIVIFMLLLLMHGAPTWAAADHPTLDLQTLMNQARDQGKQIVILPAGTFKVNHTTELDQNFETMTLTGLGKTTLIMTKLKPLLYFDGAKDISIDGITLDYDPLPFTQATITKIDGQHVEFEIQ